MNPSFFLRLFCICFLFCASTELVARESKKIYRGDSKERVLKLWGQPSQAKEKGKKSLWSYIPEKSANKLEYGLSSNSRTLNWKSRNLHILFEDGKVIDFAFLKLKAVGF